MAILELQCFWVILPPSYVKIGENHLKGIDSEQLCKAAQTETRAVVSILIQTDYITG